jgi:hypothetical protein
MSTQETGERLELLQGMPEDRGWIVAELRTSANNGRAQFYSLTPETTES